MPFDLNHAEAALNAYLNLLKSKGAATAVLNVRKHLLRHVISALEIEAGRHRNDDDGGYRYAVDSVITTFPDEQQVEIINAAREFYPFLVGDIRTIARLNAADALTLETLTVDISGSLADMFERLDRDSWSRTLPNSLVQYLDLLANQGAEAAVMDMRERLLTLLLYIIRHSEPVPTAYRAGVDAMLTLFSREESRRLFIDVAREFFYFWNGFHNGENAAVSQESA